MTEFFENLKVLVGTLGYKLFEPLASPAVIQQDNYFIVAARGANARAVLSSDGMVVIKDSQAAGSVAPSTPDFVAKLRDLLIQDGVLVSRDSCYVFSRDHLFASPSSAAAVVLGRSANGEWSHRMEGLFGQKPQRERRINRPSAEISGQR